MTGSNDALWPDSDSLLPLREVAELAGLTEVEVLELIDCGALTPDDEASGQRVFSCRSVTVARMARRLREDLELEPHGVALMLMLSERIRALEDELRDLRARFPR